MPLGQWTQEYCCGCLETWSEGLSRRGFIKVGLSGLIGMLFADWLVQQPLQAQGAAKKPSRSSCFG
jgi:hypothetical protein